MNSDDKIITIHCASYGEYEHIKPFLAEIKKEIDNLKIVVMFFSPSGYENIMDERIDFKTYTPFENIFSQYRFFSKVRPVFHLIAKHDVWPNEIFATKLLKIPRIMINASISEESSRYKYFRSFHKSLYQQFSAIFSVSGEDMYRFKTYFNVNKNIIVLGDTKRDQVLFRKNQAEKNKYLSELNELESFVFVAGSIWEEDWNKIKNGIIHALKSYKHFKSIICPHEIKKIFVENINKDLFEFSPVLMSQMIPQQLKELPKVLIVDSIGLLAELYLYGKAAFVGGSFKAKVHNVFEPAVYGIPVITGPFIINSTDALELKNNGLVVASDENEFQSILKRMYEDELYRNSLGIRAKEKVLENIEISPKLITALKEMDIL